MCIFTYIYAWSHIYICSHSAHIYVYSHTCICVSTHIHTYVCVHANTHDTDRRAERERKIESEIGRRICSHDRQEIPTAPGELASWTLRKVWSLFSVYRKVANSYTQRLSGRSPDLSFRKERVSLLQAGLQSWSWDPPCYEGWPSSHQPTKSNVSFTQKLWANPENRLHKY